MLINIALGGRPNLSSSTGMDKGILLNGPNNPSQNLSSSSFFPGSNSSLPVPPVSANVGSSNAPSGLLGSLSL